ncbi:unnamed protein product [Callosobruchus maculatus]|uniref:DUF4806 domain-containing protein n=1 Tax=Callosobruchus maculatus TaxID=64391 RepID=A0A653C374_CALMS|nr:unnamed protein product [Callosobruchus maculatus]
MLSSFNEKDLLMKVIRKQDIQNGLLSSINERLASLEDNCKNFTLSVICSVQEDSEAIFEMFDLPLDGEDQLKNFEEFLSTSTAFSKVVNEVSRLGGNSHYDFVSRVLQKIITNKLASKYSYYGRKGKAAFNTLTINQLVISKIFRIHLLFLGEMAPIP